MIYDMKKNYLYKTKTEAIFLALSTMKTTVDFP